jgi:hypothetical protein
MKHLRYTAGYGSVLWPGLAMLLYGIAAGAQQTTTGAVQASGQQDDMENSDGWVTQSHDPQHTGISSAKSQALRRIHWHTPVDLQPRLTSGELLNHYGSPLVTPLNTVIVPVKTGATNGFRVEARDGADGSVKWMLNTDYTVPSAAFLPSFGPTLSKNSVVIPAAGGTILVRDQADLPHGKVTRIAFYGLGAFANDPATFTANVRINTPITADSKGNLFFGFIVTGPTPILLQSGLARIGNDGKGSWVSASTASGDPQISKVNMNCAPAVSKDEHHVYVGVDNFDFGFGYLLELDAASLQPVNKVRLIDPVSRSDALITDQSSASPAVGPDGDVFFGVLENPFPSHHDRGWLLHFSGDLTQQKIPGGFGWDDTASIVDASLVKSYRGSSKYLLMTKYNDYADEGGTGLNQIAILDPNSTTSDLVLGNPVMGEVLTILGPTPDLRFPQPGPVREWCINTAAVDPFTKSVFANSEDGKLYRWDLTTNSFSEAMTLTGGIGEAYTPTVIGSDGTVYAINRGVLFAMGQDVVIDDGHE